MTNKIDLSPIFGVYSMREQPYAEAKALTQEFKNRVWLFCKEMVHPYDHYSQVGYKIAIYWMTLRDKLRYRHGLDHLADRHQSNPVTEVEKFLSNCSDEHYLDFIEMFFQSEKLPMHFSDRELKDAVNNINEFFNLDDLPYALTGFVVTGSRPIGRPIARLLAFAGRTLWQRQQQSHLLTDLPKPFAQPIRTVMVEAYPRVTRVESRIVQKTAIEPALTLLSTLAYREANKEFLDALTDHRKGDFRDCVVKCGSAFESVMKIICEQNGWPVGRDAGKLLNAVLDRTTLPGFLKPPLIQIATIRNELGSAHGAGAEPRDVTPHLAQYTINITASAILLLVEETKL